MATFAHIDEQRRLLDVHQKDLCRVAKVAPSTYVRLKKGHTKQADEATLTRLANGLAILQQRRLAEQTQCPGAAA